MERLVDAGNGVRLCIDEFGDPANPLALQLEGHMAPLIATPATFCTRLAVAGLYVVRVDHRDVGRSDRVGRPYLLSDLADDIHGLIGALGVGSALVCGRSMGGMVAQVLAVRHPRDVLGLGLFYTAAPSRRPGRGDSADYPEFATGADFVRWQLETLPGIAGPAYPARADDIVPVATRAWARGVDTDGYRRQLEAMRRTPDWSAGLRDVDVPVTIVHGDADPVIPVGSAYELHRLIRGAHLEIVAGMGHQQPVELDEFFARAVVDLFARRRDGR